MVCETFKFRGRLDSFERIVKLAEVRVPMWVLNKSVLEAFGPLYRLKPGVEFFRSANGSRQATGN